MAVFMEWIRSTTWRIIEAEDGGYYLQSKLGTFLSISGNTASSGMNVQMSYLESGKRQQWKFEASTYQPVKDGKYTLRSSKESEYTIDVANALKWMVRMYGCIIIMHEATAV